MRSRAARLTSTAVALIGLGAAGFFLFKTEQQIASRRQDLRAFDLHARETTTAIADLRAAQQAYVAAGQGVTFWMPKVAALQAEVVQAVDGLRSAAASTDARASLMESSSHVTEFGNVDKRARDYLKSGQTLMAGDVVFTEGGQTAAEASRLVESARLAEHRMLDADEAGLRRREAAAAGGAIGLLTMVMLLLAFSSPRAEADAAEAGWTSATEPAGSQLMLHETPAGAAAVQGAFSALPRGSAPVLRAAAELCTEFNRATDPSDLPRLLARAADVMDASGLVVWLGDPKGADLRPVLAHGYSEQVLARMPVVPKSADNAAAAAYRTGKLQIVLKRPGVSNGAVVAPLLAADGCVGALTAEILSGSEVSDSVQSLAALVASQLAGTLGGSLAAPVEARPSKAASA